MKIKISYHIMPWEIDYAFLSFMQLKKSSFYLPDDVTVKIDAALNLSNYLIDWDKTKLPKQFFIDKFNDLGALLEDYEYNPIIYEGENNYGFFDVQKIAYEPDIDYYMGLCPDIYFSEHLLYSLIESAKQVPNKYFVITPEIYKMWDATWDEITNKDYINVPYEEWNQGDIFKIRHNLKNSEDEIYLHPTRNSKWAWWADLYSKEFYEVIAPIPDDWTGYGGWDYYAMLLSEHIQEQGCDFQQYLLKGQTIFEYPIGSLKEKGFVNYHKKYFSIKQDAPNQRKIFESNLNNSLNKQIQILKSKDIT
tara:strand:- start:8258 stop:9175 length:918 start_codon:yes stop_codon:yes gene_type:complete